MTQDNLTARQKDCAKLRNHFAADYDLIATIKRGAVNDN